MDSGEETASSGRKPTKSINCDSSHKETSEYFTQCSNVKCESLTTCSLEPPLIVVSSANVTSPDLLNIVKHSINSANFSVDNLIATEEKTNEQHIHSEPGTVSHVEGLFPTGDGSVGYKTAGYVCKDSITVSRANSDSSNSVPDEMMQSLQTKQLQVGQQTPPRKLTRDSDQDFSLPTTLATTKESHVCGTTVRTSPPPVILSPTSSNLVTSWSLQHLLVSSTPSAEHENRSSQLTQSSNMPDSLMFHSPEKSIEQAVNAALCSLERDMENTEEEEELSPDDITESSLDSKSTMKDGSDKTNSLNAPDSPTR